MKDDAIITILVTNQSKVQFFTHAQKIERPFQAIFPDTSAGQFCWERKVIQIVAGSVRNNNSQDIINLSSVMAEMNRVPDTSIKLKYPINSDVPHVLDMSQVDFDTLKKLFEKSCKHIEVDCLRGKIGTQLQAIMLRLNKSRKDNTAKFEHPFADYNAGGKDIDASFLVELIAFTRSLSEEEQRGVADNLSKEELANFDLLTRPTSKLTEKERGQVKQVAKKLLDTLKDERLVLDRRNQQKTAPPTVWRFSIRANNSLNRIQLNSMNNNVNWSTCMCVKHIREASRDKIELLHF